MSLCNGLAFKLIKSVRVRNLGTQTAPAVKVPEDELQTFRTKESNPANHTTQHLGKFYTIPKEHIEPMIGKNLVPYQEMKLQIKTFTEWSLLVRKPALEVIQYLSHTDYSKPVNKYVLYGDQGTGKSLSLCHILHYGYCTQKLIIHVPWVQQWFRFPRETANSSRKEGMVDLPIDGAKFLANFQTVNHLVLPKIDLKLSKNYEFGVNETFAKGAPITDIINFGIERLKYSCDVIEALFYEIKQASIAGKCNTLVTIDGFNAFYSVSTQVRNDFRKFVPASSVTLTHSFLELTKSDWCNGQIVLTVDKIATKERRESFLPRYLLEKKGFDHIDPFLPINVENFTEDEFDTVIEYYKNRKWIRDITPEGQKELRLLCGSNPYKIMEYCKQI